MERKSKIYHEELQKLTKIFEKVEESKRRLVEGLIQDAAFLLAENFSLKESIKITGMVKIHPKRNDLQKTTEAAKQYLRNVNSYSVVIKTLNGVLNKNMIDEDDDDLNEFE